MLSVPAACRQSNRQSRVNGVLRNPGPAPCRLLGTDAVSRVNWTELGTCKTAGPCGGIVHVIGKGDLYSLRVVLGYGRQEEVCSLDLADRSRDHPVAQSGKRPNCVYVLFYGN